MPKKCPRCASTDTVSIGRFNPDESEAWKCLDCEKEWIP
jgi:transposase-like protein